MDMQLRAKTSFSEALREHLDSIRARDIERFSATVSRSGDVRVVGPGAGITQGFENVIEAHRGWFASPFEWSFEPEILWTHETPEMTLALLDVRYHESPQDKEPREIGFLLSMVFVRENDGWYFLYDQNTPRMAATGG